MYNSFSIQNFLKYARQLSNQYSINRINIIHCFFNLEKVCHFKVEQVWHCKSNYISTRFSTHINLLHNWYINKHLLSVDYTPGIVPSPKEFHFSIGYSLTEGRSSINKYQNQKTWYVKVEGHLNIMGTTIKKQLVLLDGVKEVDRVSLVMDLETWLRQKWYIGAITMIIFKRIEWLWLYNWSVSCLIPLDC